jgi:hypothetical protein
MYNYPNYAVFTNNKYIANKRPFMTWYDGTHFCNGRGKRVDIACIDMNLPKDVILEIIIPTICFNEDNNIFIWNDSIDNFKKTTIGNVLEMLN